MLSSPGSKGQRSGSPVTSPARTARGFAYTGSAAGHAGAERRTSPTKRPDGQPLLPSQRSLSTRRLRRLLQARWWRPATLLPLAFGVLLLLLISQLAPWDGGDAVLSYPDLTGEQQTHTWLLQPTTFLAAFLCCVFGVLPAPLQRCGCVLIMRTRRSCKPLAAVVQVRCPRSLARCRHS